MQTYDVKITVLSPLHIGSGERPGRKSRWHDQGRVWIVDQDALFQQVSDSPRLLSRFEQFCLSRHRKLGDFLHSARIDPQTVALYSLPCIGGWPNNYYFSHIKVPGRPPQPYIPGSTLKGALRSALLRARIIGDARMQKKAAGLVRQQMRGRRPSRKHAGDALERAVFGSDQHHEWTRLFQVADTQPIPVENLWATEVRIRSVRGPEGRYHLEEKKLGRGRSLTLYPEVIRPGSVLQTRLTIQDELLSSSASGELRFPREYGDAARLLKACNRTAKEQIIQEWTFADETGWRIGQGFYGWMTERLEGAMQSDGCLLRLGWGAGFDDKTMTDLLDDDTFREVLDTYGLTVGRPGRRRSNPPMGKKFAPKSRNVALDNKDRWLPLGWVQLQLIPRGAVEAVNETVDETRAMSETVKAEETVQPPVQVEAPPKPPVEPSPPPAQEPPEPKPEPEPEEPKAKIAFPGLKSGEHTGVVTYFNLNQGKGRILPDGSEEEIEVLADWLRQGLLYLARDQKVSFVVVRDEDGWRLEDVGPV